MLATLPLLLLVLWESVPAQGTPGVPQSPVVVFTENFENVATPAVAVFLNAYTGAPPLSMTYTAHPNWISGPACNGLIASWNSTPGTTGCPASLYDLHIRSIARALGNAFGGGDDNQVMSDVTVAGFPAAATPAATLETVNPVPLPSSNRFIAFSIDVGVTSCALPADPLLRFFLVDGATELSVNSTAINPCTAAGGPTVPGGSGGIRVGSFATDGAILFAGNAVGIKLTNDQTGGSGNDYAVDNIRLLDATPQLDKSFADDLVGIGASTTLTFTITNTTELAAKPGWSFTDALPAGLTIANPANATTNCSSGAINAPTGGNSVQVSGNLLGGQASCTASVRVTSSQVATYVNGPANITQSVGLDAPGSDDVEFFGTPGISLQKTGSGPDPLTVSSTINYAFLVTNTGNVTLSNVTVTDPLPGLPAISCPSTTLAPSATMTCTASYQVTQADVNAGVIQNTATASGNPSSGPAVSDTSSATFPPLQVRSISLQKSGSGPNPLVVGSTITYAFLVTNTGNVTLSSVTVTDPLPGLSPINCPSTTLAPVANMTCTAGYQVTQADVNAGRIVNTATVTGNSPGGPAVSDTSSAAFPPLQAPGISLQKTGSGPTPLVLGATVTYTFVVANIGNVTLASVAVADGLPGLSPITCPGTSLAPTADMTCTANYTVTQANVNAGVIQNTATASGSPPNGPAVTDQGSATLQVAAPVPVMPVAALLLLMGLLGASAAWMLRHGRVGSR